MNSDLSLLTIPEVPLKHILEKCDYLSIQCLRKTCRYLRHSIGNTNLDISIYHLRLEFGPTSYTCYATFSPNKLTKLEYSDFVQKQKDDELESSKCCKIKKDDKEYIVKSDSFREVFLHDLELFARQCSIEYLLVHAIVDVTGLNLPQIKTEKIKLVCNPKNVIDILPHLDEKSIKVIDVCFGLMESQLETDEIVKLQQWKNAEKVFLFYGSVNDTKIESFAHFRNVNVKFETFDLEDVKDIIKVFSHNPKMDRFYLWFRDNDGYNQPRTDAIRKVLIDRFEEPKIIPNFPFLKYYWIFNIQNSKNFLQMSLVGGGVTFARLKEKVAVSFNELPE